MIRMVFELIKALYRELILYCRKRGREAFLLPFGLIAFKCHLHLYERTNCSCFRRG